MHDELTAGSIVTTIFATLGGILIGGLRLLGGVLIGGEAFMLFGYFIIDLR